MLSAVFIPLLSSGYNKCWYISRLILFFFLFMVYMQTVCPTLTHSRSIEEVMTGMVFTINYKHIHTLASLLYLTRIMSSNISLCSWILLPSVIFVMHDLSTQTLKCYFENCVSLNVFWLHWKIRKQSLQSLLIHMMTNYCCWQLNSFCTYVKIVSGRDLRVDFF